MRPASLDDAVFIAGLLSLHLPEPASAEVVRRQLTAPGVDIERDTCIDDHAAAVVTCEGEEAWLDLAGEPNAELLAWAWRRAGERGAVRLATATWDEHGPSRGVLEAAGFTPATTLLRMRVDLSGASYDPVWPEGVTARTYRDGDAPRIHALHVAGSEDPPTEDYAAWAHAHLGPPYFEPSLWFLAEAGPELTGILLCSPHPAFLDVALIAVFAVAPSWRGRGLGRALLEFGFATLVERGFTAAILGVDEDNPSPVVHLLDSEGMRVTRRRFGYAKTLA